jgi:hypothetical protein
MAAPSFVLVVSFSAVVLGTLAARASTPTEGG